MNKEFWGTFGGQVAASLLPLAIVGIVGLLIWRKLFGSQTASDVVGNVAESAASIPSGVVSLIDSKVLGQSDSTYITNEQARQLAQQRLAQRRAGGA